MGTGWRRAFCTSIPREPESEKQQRNQSPSPSPSPRSCAKLGFFSNPSTPRLSSQPPVTSPGLRCRTAATSPTVQDSPRLVCKTSTPTSKSPRLFQNSNPSSPKSPSRFALFRSPRLRLSKSSCGICLQSVKTGQGTAIFTAECSHAFHFPCIAAHVRKQGCLVCPVCNATWREVPLLAIHRQQQSPETHNDDSAAVEEEKLEKPEKPKSGLNPLSKTSSDSRLYDDDEPLISPRFNPIPEADEVDGEGEEEEEEEVGEFQGFFANPSSAKSEAAGVEEVPAAAAARVVDARLLPEAAVVSSAGRSHESYAVALRVRAPAPPSSRNRRAPVDLVTVLDVGGSMTGAKLHMLRRAMRLVVASLGPADRLSVVAFSGGAKRLMPLRRMTPHGQRAARRIVDRLACGGGGAGGGSCVGEALRKATKVLEDRRERNPVASIMLLSDGQEEQQQRHHSNDGSGGRRRPTAAASTRFAHLEIPVHSFGFGGGPQQQHQDAFAKCIGGLLSVVVQDLRVHLGFASGEIAGVYTCAGRPALLGSSSVRLGDLYAEEERELLLELRVPAAAIGAHHVLSVGFSYRDPASQEVVQCREQALLVPRPHAVRSSDPKIERLRNLFVTTRAIAEARRMADHNDLSGAHHLLASARALLLQSSSISADANLRGLEAELAELQARRQHHLLLLQQQQPHYLQQPPPPQGRRRGEQHPLLDDNGEPLTPTSAWRAAEQLAKVAIMRKSMNRVSDLHGFENARF